MVNPNDPAAIPYVISEDDGAFWYIAYKEKNPGVPYITVSSKGVANGLSTEYNDGYDFGPDSYNPNISSGIPLTQTSGIQEAIAYGYSRVINPSAGQPGITIYLVSSGYFVLNTSVHFLSTENVWHNIISDGRGAVAITAPAGSTFPFFVVDNNFIEDLQFRGIVFYPQTSSQSVLYYGGTTQLPSDYHFEDCFFDNLQGEIDIDLASIGQFTMNQCFGAVVISIPQIADYCHINNTRFNKVGNVLGGASSVFPAVITLTDVEIYDAVNVGSSTTFLSVSNCNLSMDGVAMEDGSVNVLEIGSGTNIVRLSRITMNGASPYNLLSAQPTYLEIDNSLAPPNNFSDYPYYPNSTTNGTTAGTVQIVLQRNTHIYKKYMITFSGYENDTTTAQTIDFPLAFATSALISGNNTGLTISATTTGITITAPDSTTTYTGIVIVEGY